MRPCRQHPCKLFSSLSSAMPDGTRDSNPSKFMSAANQRFQLMHTTQKLEPSSLNWQVLSATRRQSRCLATRSRPRAGPRAPCVYQKPSACAYSIKWTRREKRSASQSTHQRCSARSVAAVSPAPLAFALHITTTITLSALRIYRRKRTVNWLTDCCYASAEP